MSAQPVEAIDRNTNCGGLKPGVRPGVTGWYWARREGWSAPECVYVIPENTLQMNHPGIIHSVGAQQQNFRNSDYYGEGTKWFGPIEAPAAVGFW